jgi:hypothetical protein
MTLRKTTFHHEGTKTPRNAPQAKGIEYEEAELTERMPNRPLCLLRYLLLNLWHFSFEYKTLTQDP